MSHLTRMMYYAALALLRAGCPDATIRDGGKALEAAQQAHAPGRGPAEMAALAAAHAELGHFDMAALWQEKAIAAAPAWAKKQYRDRLKKYQDRKPYRLERRSPSHRPKKEARLVPCSMRMRIVK